MLDSKKFKLIGSKAEEALLAELYWALQYPTQERLLNISYLMTADGIKAINNNQYPTYNKYKEVAEWNTDFDYWVNLWREQSEDTTIEDLRKENKIDERKSYLFSAILHELFRGEHILLLEAFNRKDSLDEDKFDSLNDSYYSKFCEFLYTGIDQKDSYPSRIFKSGTICDHANFPEFNELLDFDKILDSFKEFGEHFKDWFKRKIPTCIRALDAGNYKDYYFTNPDEEGCVDILVHFIVRSNEYCEPDLTTWDCPFPLRTMLNSDKDAYFK